MALAAGNKRSMIEELPSDVLAKVLDYLDIPSRVKLARGNHSLQQRVYNECPLAWNFINFRDMGKTFRDRLTDSEVSSLLVRVDALHVTKILILSNCSKIQGRGLLPLYGSRVLAAVCLDGTDIEANKTQVVWTLRSMFPFKLLQVLIGEDDVDQCFLELKENLKHARFEQERQESIPCDSCHQTTLEKTRQCIPSEHGYPSFQCFKCYKHFCRRPSCKMRVRECKDCGEAYCSNADEGCDVVEQCFFCGSSRCKWCHGGAHESCSECKRIFCDPCDRMDYCTNGNCMARICKDCGPSPEHCTNACLFCKSCKDTGARCAECKEKFCFDCTAGSKACDSCSNVYCGKPSCHGTTECGACHKDFCRECKDFEHCTRCDKGFCTDHNRLVDCGSCEIRHCRTCSSPCDLCGTGCYEACVCVASKRQKCS